MTLHNTGSLTTETELVEYENNKFLFFRKESRVDFEAWIVQKYHTTIDKFLRTGVLAPERKI
jgi:hypothetical protein